MPENMCGRLVYERSDQAELQHFFNIVCIDPFRWEAKRFNSRVLLLRVNQEMDVLSLLSTVIKRETIMIKNGTTQCLKYTF